MGALLMLVEDELKVFTEGMLNYFESTTNESASIGTPFLTENIDDYIQEYTGVISISGDHQGSVIFTATKPLLKHVLWAMEILDSKPSLMRDLVGEIGNTISGNARAKFGDQFIVSVPKVIDTNLESKVGSHQFKNYVIPLVWRHSKANLIVNFDRLR